MLVREWMSKPAITIDYKDSMQHALDIMKRHNIQFLPVLKKEKLVGVLTDRDLKRASASKATTLDVHELHYLIDQIKVSDLMSSNPITVAFDLTIEETAEILLKSKISGVPVVVDKTEVVGVITKDDIFRALISLTGVGKRGIQFACIIKDKPGSVMEVANLVRSAGGRMVSILTAYDRASKGYRRLFIRLNAVDRKKLPELKKVIQEKATLLYVVDHRENKRELFV